MVVSQSATNANFMRAEYLPAVALAKEGRYSFLHMLRSPRRLPQRFNRRITPQTRTFTKRRHQRNRQFFLHRARLFWHRFQRKSATLRVLVVRFALWLGIGLCTLVVGMLLFSPLITVREVRVVRSDARIDIERVQRLLKPLFGRHLFFLSAQEVLPLLRDGLPATAQNPAQPGLPDLASVTVSKRYPATLVLRLTLDPLIARLQLTQTVSAKAATGALTADYLTSHGVYVTYLPDQTGSGNLLPQLKIVDWNQPPIPFTPLLTPAFLQTMANAEEALRDQFGQAVRSRTVFLRGQEFHLLTQEYALWFDVKSPLERQLARYRLFLQTAGKGAAKEYIDLRLTDRVVYK